MANSRRSLHECFLSWKGNETECLLLQTVAEACMKTLLVRSKNCTGQLSCLAFQLSSSEHSCWFSLSINSSFSRLLIRQSLPENHGNVRQRLGILIKEWTPNTPASLNFYRCHSTNTIQQAGGEVKWENLFFIKDHPPSIWMIYSQCQLFYNRIGFFLSRLDVKVQVSSSPQFYVHIIMELFMQASCIYA